MKPVNHPPAKMLRSKPVDAASKRKPPVVAEVGKARVKVTMPEGQEPKRLGFLKGKSTVPEGFDDMGGAELEALFVGQGELRTA